jgi:hypothetical protein
LFYAVLKKAIKPFFLVHLSFWGDLLKPVECLPFKREFGTSFMFFLQRASLCESKLLVTTKKKEEGMTFWKSLLLIMFLGGNAGGLSKGCCQEAGPPGPRGPRGFPCILEGLVAFQNDTLTLGTPSNEVNVPGLFIEFEVTSATSQRRVQISSSGSMTLVPFLPPQNASSFVTIRAYIDEEGQLLQRGYLLIGSNPATSINNWNIDFVSPKVLDLGHHSVTITAQTSLSLVPGTSPSDVAIGDTLSSNFTSTATGVVSLIVF